jgi:hypothetical protein
MAGHHIEILKRLEIADSLRLDFFDQLTAIPDETGVV